MQDYFIFLTDDLVFLTNLYQRVTVNLPHLKQRHARLNCKSCSSGVNGWVSTFSHLFSSESNHWTVYIRLFEIEFKGSDPVIHRFIPTKVLNLDHIVVSVCFSIVRWMLTYNLVTFNIIDKRCSIDLITLWLIRITYTDTYLSYKNGGICAGITLLCQWYLSLPLATFLTTDSQMSL